MKLYPKYKDSGIEWIGEVPEHWEVKRIKYFFRLITEKNSTLKTKKVALENIESWTGRFIDSEVDYQGEGISFLKGDVLFGKLRPYLAKVLNAKFSGASVGDIFVMRPKLGISSRFAFYRFLSKPFIDIVNGSTFGAKMPRASWNFITNLYIAVPGYDEQGAIATYLDRKTTQIDNLISKKQKLIELLKEERAAIINQAVTKGLNPDAPMKDSGIEWLGEIPVHWEVMRLKYITRITLGKMLTNIDKGGYHYRSYLRAQNINWEKVNVEDIKKMWFSKDELHQYRLNKNDLLVSEGGEVGRTSIWDEEIEECYIQNSVHKVTMKSTNDPFFFLYTFCLYGEKGVFESVVSRISIAHLTKEKLKETVFPVPPNDEQERISKFISAETTKIDQTISKIKKQIDLLKEFRTSLISEAVTGKIDVRDGGSNG